MSGQAESTPLAGAQWILRKLVGLFIIYVALGSVYKSIVADNAIAAAVYVLLGIVGFYLLSNW